MVNPVLRRMVLAYSVRNRRRKVRSIQDFMAANGLRTVVVVGVAGDSDQPNEDVVEHALTRSADVVAAVPLADEMRARASMLRVH